VTWLLAAGVMLMGAGAKAQQAAGPDILTLINSGQYEAARAALRTRATSQAEQSF
jgi:hypothetical protein